MCSGHVNLRGRERMCRTCSPPRATGSVMISTGAAPHPAMAFGVSQPQLSGGVGPGGVDRPDRLLGRTRWRWRRGGDQPYDKRHLATPTYSRTASASQETRYSRRRMPCGWPARPTPRWSSSSCVAGPTGPVRPPSHRQCAPLTMINVATPVSLRGPHLRDQGLPRDHQRPRRARARPCS
jgi:hypothetical protein